MKDDKILVKGTMTVDERLQNRVAKNESTTDLNLVILGKNQTKELAKKNCHLQPSNAVNLRVVISSF